jgi:hypothetical protein
MGYVIAIVLVLLIVAGFVTFMVLNATRRSSPAAPEDPGAQGDPSDIVAPDEAPLGDTTQHAGEQHEGQTVRDAERSAATGGDGGDERARVGDPPPDAPTPDSERLANRPR